MFSGTLNHATDVLLHESYLSPEEKAHLTQLIRDAVALANPGMQLSESIPDLIAEYKKVLDLLNQQESTSYKITKRRDEERNRELSLQIEKDKKARQEQYGELSKTLDRAKEEFDFAIELATSQGIPNALFSYPEEIYDRKAYIIDDSLDTPGECDPLFGFVSIHPNYLSQVHASLHESIHRAFYISKYKNIQANIAELYNIPFKDGMIVIGAKQFQQLSQADKDLFLRRNQMFLLKKQVSINEGLIEWTLHTLDRYHLQRGDGRKVRSIDAYRPQIDSIEELKQNIMKKAKNKEEYVDAVIITAALTGNVEVLRRMAGDEDFRGFVNKIPTVSSVKNF